MTIDRPGNAPHGELPFRPFEIRLRSGAMLRVIGPHRAEILLSVAATRRRPWSRPLAFVGDDDRRAA